MIIIVIGAVIFGVIGMAIGDHGGKGNGAMGGLLGALLGPIGCVIAAVLPKDEAAQTKEKGAAPETEKQRIARLEAEIAKLSGGTVPGEKKIIPRAKDDLASDGEVPTYRLD